jgi:Flp pilus assembly protein TadG
VSRRRSERGQTAVEFALVIPVMLLFLLGIFQIGITYFNNEAIATAARDGARAGAIHTGSTPAQIIAFATAAVKNSAVGLDQSNLTVTVVGLDNPQATNGTLWDQGDIIDVTVTYPWRIGVLAFSASGTLTTHTQLRME